MMRSRLNALPNGNFRPSFMPARGAILQRKCACGSTPARSGECEACRKKELQPRSESLEPFSISHSPSSVSEVPPIVHDVLRSPGQPLDEQTRAFMEPRFGHDFRHVRVHTDAAAVKSADAVNALAYTVRNDLVFGHGLYKPETIEGKRLLAHELTHVVQQSRTTPARSNLVLANPYDSCEREAETHQQSLDSDATFEVWGNLLCNVRHALRSCAVRFLFPARWRSVIVC